MRTAQAAAQAGVNVQTLRYYERRGLLSTPARRGAGGYRDYTAADVGVVRFSKRAQALGFSLAEVESLLELGQGGPDSCDAVRDHATAKIADLDSRIACLQAMRGSLERLVATCERPRAERECPLLPAIERLECQPTCQEPEAWHVNPTRQRG